MIKLIWAIWRLFLDEFDMFHAGKMGQIYRIVDGLAVRGNSLPPLRIYNQNLFSSSSKVSFLSFDESNTIHVLD
jgi:hypothetical protein